MKFRIKILDGYYIDNIYKDDKPTGRYGGHTQAGQLISYDDCIGIQTGTKMEAATITTFGIANKIGFITKLMKYDVIPKTSIELELVDERFE